MIEGRWNAAGFTRAMTSALRGRLRRGGGRSSASNAHRWRRADWLWPDFAPRYED